jgi:cytochrome c peroxidase
LVAAATLILTAGVAVSVIAARVEAPRAAFVAQETKAAFSADVDSLDASLAILGATLSAPPNANDEQIHMAFLLARTRYKHVEAILEFYSPALAAALNSRRQEIDDDDQPPPSTLAPSGFPALERALWPSVNRDSIVAARKTVDGMRNAMTRLRWLAQDFSVTESQFIEFSRLELVRISTLGIAGFDAPITGAALTEAADALDAERSLFIRIAPRWPTLAREANQLEMSLARASTYLRGHRDFDTSDRLTIIVDYLEPVARSLDVFRRAAKIPPLVMPRQLRASAALPYDIDAFDTRIYAPSGTPDTTRNLIVLGKRLFNEPILSKTRARSCASCHLPGRAFSDGLVVAASIDPHAGRVSRNTPTLINAGLEPTQFADERAVTLEDQVVAVLRSPAEMGSSIERATDAVGNDATYRAQFARAFGTTPEHAVTPLRLRQALAAYVRSLVALDSRFDRAVHGDRAALTAEERTGFTLFMSKAGCGTCHFAPLFSGDTPPLYHASDVEVIGTPRVPSRARELDPDSGRARIDHLPNHLRAFKTPTLRNIALTAPYMHNGAFKTLGEVLDFYDHGGGLGAGAKIDDQTLAADSLHLSAGEKRAIIAFLKTLTDTNVVSRANRAVAIGSR